MGYRYSDNCVRKLEQLEGFRQMVYLDGGGLPTVGYGQRCLKDAYPNGINQQEAEQFLRKRLDSICLSLDAILPGLLPHQVDSLCILIYNIGGSAFVGSEIYRRLRRNDYEAFQHWALWCHDAKGVSEPGLVSRRLFEIELFIWGWGA